MLSRRDSINFIKSLISLLSSGRSKFVWFREEMTTRSVRFLVLMLIAVMAFGSGTGALSTAGARSGAARIPSPLVRVGNAGLSERAIKTLRAGDASAPLNFMVGPADSAFSRAFVANSASLRVELEKGTMKMSGHGASLRMDLLGANSNATITGTDPQKSRSDDRGKEHQVAYRQLEYRDVYAGIDAKVSAGDGSLSYTLILAPGANPTWVSAGFTGVGKPALSTAGELKLGRNSLGWTVLAPVGYQETDGKKLEVPVNFILDENGHLGLAVASYDRGKPLTVTLIIKG